MVLDQKACQIFHITQDGFLGLCTNLNMPSFHENVIVTLVTREVDAWHKYLVKNNVQIEKTPSHNPQFNIYQMFFRDPNGYLFEIQQFMSPEWLEN